jgi:hypothetical protein
MLNDLVRNEALNDYQRKQIERIIKVAYEEGRIMEFRINNNINRNIDNDD